MERTKTKNAGFTLVEMLIVTLIIVLLAGMVFRLVGLVGRNNSRNTTRATLEKTAAALEEFKSIYGKYPPSSSTTRIWAGAP